MSRLSAHTGSACTLLPRSLLWGAMLTAAALSHAHAATSDALLQLSETQRITVNPASINMTVPSTSTPNSNNSPAIFSGDAIEHPLWAKNGMVASQESLASEAGLQMLRDGGNAVDAAVAVGFALAVTLPRAGNIGGGGFMMIYDAKQNKTIALDYREKAPSSAFRDMYLDKEGNAVSERSRYHGLAVGVPGTVAGLLKALDEHGTMSRDRKSTRLNSSHAR